MAQSALVSEEIARSIVEIKQFSSNMLASGNKVKDNVEGLAQLAKRLQKMVSGYKL